MESRISGTPNNDTYQKFMDEYQKIGKEMNDMYQKIKGDTLLTEVQRDSLMEVLDKKETEGMDRIYQLVSENIASSKEEPNMVSKCTPAALADHVRLFFRSRKSTAFVGENSGCFC